MRKPFNTCGTSVIMKIGKMKSKDLMPGRPSGSGIWLNVSLPRRSALMGVPRSKLPPRPLLFSGIRTSNERDAKPTVGDEAAH